MLASFVRMWEETLGKLHDLGLDQPWLDIFLAVEVRHAKPGVSAIHGVFTTQEFGAIF